MRLLPEPDPPPTDLPYSLAPTCRLAGQAGQALHTLVLAGNRALHVPEAVPEATPLPTRAGHQAWGFGDHTALVARGAHILPWVVRLDQGGEMAALAQWAPTHLPSWSGRVATTTAHLEAGDTWAPWAPITAPAWPDLARDLTALLASMLGPWASVSPASLGPQILELSVEAAGRYIPTLTPSLALRGSATHSLHNALVPGEAGGWVRALEEALPAYARAQGRPYAFMAQERVGMAAYMRDICTVSLAEAKLVPTAHQRLRARALHAALTLPTPQPKPRYAHLAPFWA